MTSENINTDLLITQLRQGNEQAFTSLYDMFASHIYRNILRLVKDEEIAQEILQDLFLKVWEIREKIKVEGSFKSFLHKVAANMVYMHFRQVSKNERLIEKLIASSVEYVTNDEDNAIPEASYDLLQKAIESLPAKRKQIYILCKLEGKSYEEVSKELGISTSTISDSIVKANKAVKQYFLSNPNMGMLLAVTCIFMSKK
jgi:RNA polymerase sigma factor (sigma-70 family)